MFDSFLSGSLLAEGSALGLSGYVVAILLIIAIALGFALAHLIANGLNVNDYRQRLAWVLIPLLVAALMIATGWPPKFGVDLRGGINMIGSLNLEAVDNEDPNYVPPKAQDIIPVLIKRVNPSGTKEIMIRALGEDKIEVTIPSVSLEEAEGIWDSIVKTGKLEFRICASRQFADHAGVIKAAEDASRSADFRDRRSKFVTTPEGERIGVWVGVAKIIPTAADIEAGELPSIMPYKFAPRSGHLIRNKATGQIVPLNTLQYKDGDALGLEFGVWCRDNGIQVPEILMMYPKENQDVQGKHLSSVRAQFDDKGRPAIGFSTTAEGMGKLGLLTRLNTEPDGQPKKELGIVLDGKLSSAPTINSTIRSNGEISGSFTQNEVNELKRNLDSGKLDVALNKNPISRNFVESTLGNELRTKGIWAIGFSLILVLIFMCFYYRFAGVIATISLILNLALILALIMFIQQPLTLTGLAGLVLTVGMSVDANVLIFERIREELDRGAALRMAIRNGFDKATVTILDANITTLFTAVALYAIGTEQIKGFAVTLILGILMSMYTAIYCSRLMFDISERRGWLKKLNMRRVLEKAKFDFISKISMTSVLSAAAIGIGILSMFTLGPKILDHDLRGGSTIRMVFKEPQKIEDLRAKLNAEDIVVKDEKVEFTVSSFGDLGTSAEHAGRIFKVDSNLPAWEGGPDGNKWEQLNEVMTRVFGEKLEMHNATVETGAPLSALPVKRTNTQTASRKLPYEAPSWNAVTVSAINLLSPNMILQDDGVVISTDQPVETAVETEVVVQSDAPVIGTDAPVVETEVQVTDAPAIEPDVQVMEADSPAVESEAKVMESDAPTIGSDTKAMESDTKMESANSIGEDPASEVSSAFADESGGGAATAVLADKVSRKLSFGQPITGKTLKELVLQAAVSLDLELDENALAVSSPDTDPGESSLGTVSQDWTVEMEKIAPENADDILSKWSSDFNGQPYFPMASKVGGQIAKNMQGQALTAALVGLLLIIGYVWFRFQNLAFGLAAVIALLHDVAVVLGVIAITHYLAGGLGFLGITNFKISLAVVAAILTVIGYSLNDTIVVFDRIREVRGKRQEITADIINTSISQTLSRTLLTSLTTFIVVFILYCFGGDAIHSFAFTLVIGVIVGTYSSIFIASPALLWLMNTVGLNPMDVDPEVAAEK